ncbi:hypothetical protein PSR1_00401 [Anaeromyxobacter sp. PSR-1]|nr:hypothetical protein PSR1_00401 [Anaeromyxobacter sp. PSR-1]
MATSGCIHREIRLPLRLRDRVPAQAAFQFVILADGRMVGFRAPTEGMEPEFACAVWRALSGCPWTPGRDAQGRPGAYWVELPIRFSAPPTR